MAVGFFSEGVCWAIAQEAIDAHFQSIPPTILPSATNTIFNFYQKQGNGVWNSVKQTRSTTGALTTNFTVAETNPILISCTTPNDPVTSFLSGVELGWAVAGVVVIAYCLQRLRRGW